MTDLADNNALFSANTAQFTPFLSVPYLNADTKLLTYPTYFGLESQRNRSPWLATSPVDGKALSSMEYEWWRWMFVMAIWGDKFCRDNGLKAVPLSTATGMVEGSLLDEGVA